MKSILNDVEQWLEQDHAVALATLVKTKGSSPREVGAVMAVSDTGEVTGSISGGCVEVAVIEEALAVIAEGKPRLLSYGVADELDFEIGLTCGGTIEVFVERLEQNLLEDNLSLRIIFDVVRQTSEQSCVLCTMVKGTKPGAKMLVNNNEESFGSFSNQELDRIVNREAQEFLAQGLNALRYYDISYYDINGEGCQTKVAIFIQSFVPPPHLIIFGVVDFTRSLCKLAKMLGYRVTICDARSRLATPARFPEADAIIWEWPGQYLRKTKIDDRTVIAVLTHDPKFDIPALVSAVGTPAAYIGAMGSRKATADRIGRLQEAGLSKTDINRISAPIGLDIGANTPDETAVSIMAEVIAQKNGRSGSRLSFGHNPIHTRLGVSGAEQKITTLC